MDISMIKETVLQLAIQGKLVPQNDHEEPASELLRKMAAEKERLIAEGKIRKQKALLPIEDEEKPFEIPDNWRWVRLGSITNYGAPASIKPEQLSSEDWVLELEDIEKDTSRILRHVMNSARKSKSNKYSFVEGQVLYGKLRPYLNKVVIAKENGYCSTEIMPIRSQSQLYPSFLFVVLKSSYFINYVNKLTYGVKMPRLGTNDARNTIIPLPPKEEQKRIVAKLDELFALCDRLETEKKNMLEYVDIFKQEVLNQAVRGKLTEQRNDDEPASELLRKIAAEKKRLVDEGTIRRQKALPPIEEDKKPFEVPDNWEWVRLGDIFEITSSKRVHQSDWKKVGIPFIRAREIVSLHKGENFKTPIFISVEHYEALKKQTGVPRKKDILVTGVGTVGIPYIAEGEDFYFKDGNIVWFKNHFDIYAEFIQVVLSSPYAKKVINNASGTTVKTFTIIKGKHMCIPLPPLEEQQRIVAIMDELFALADSIVEELNDEEYFKNRLNEVIESREQVS